MSMISRDGNQINLNRKSLEYYATLSGLAKKLSIDSEIPSNRHGAADLDQVTVDLSLLKNYQNTVEAQTEHPEAKQPEKESELLKTINTYAAYLEDKAGDTEYRARLKESIHKFANTLESSTSEYLSKEGNYLEQLASDIIKNLPNPTMADFDKIVSPDTVKYLRDAEDGFTANILTSKNPAPNNLINRDLVSSYSTTEFIGMRLHVDAARSNLSSVVREKLEKFEKTNVTAEKFDSFISEIGEKLEKKNVETPMKTDGAA